MQMENEDLTLERTTLSPSVLVGLNSYIGYSVIVVAASLDLVG